jgi:hypothetical protein
MPEQPDNILDKIQEILGEIPGNVSVLQQQINADIQTEYYHCSREIGLEFDPAQVLQDKENLFNQEFSADYKKKLIVRLAKIGNLESLKTLKRFLHSPEKSLRAWTSLAIEGNKLLLESKILDENKILISTGLGGKDLKLRYFTALMRRSGTPFSKLERKVIHNELDFALKACKGEAEKIIFNKELCQIVSLIPLEVPIPHLFKILIRECNVYGDFLQDDCLITNVRILTGNQIRKMIRKNIRE